MAIRLFVGNLPNNFTETELREHFSEVGPLSFISVPTDRETGRQRGFAFLEFREDAHATEAIRSFNNKSFKGNPLTVKEARPKDDRGPFRPSSSPPYSTADTSVDNPPVNKPNPNFGPDASPQRSRGKAKNKPGSERSPKGPMREVVRGQFFGETDDDYDDYDDIDDYDEFDDFDSIDSDEKTLTDRDNDGDIDNSQS